MSSLGWNDEIQEVIFMASYTKSISCWDQSGNYYTVLGGKVYYAVATSTSSSPSAPSLSTSSSSVSVSSYSTVSPSKVTRKGMVPYAWPTAEGTYFTYAARYFNGQGKWATEGPITWGGYVKKEKTTRTLMITISKSFSTSLKIQDIIYATVGSLTITSTSDNDVITIPEYNVSPNSSTMSGQYLVFAKFVRPYSAELSVGKTYEVAGSQISIWGVVEGNGNPCNITTLSLSNAKFTVSSSSGPIDINLN